MNIKLTSPVFAEGQPIPTKYTCDGEDVSPPLRWSGVPDRARSLVLLCEDPDAPTGLFVHWVLYGLGAVLTELTEGVPKMETVFDSGRHGVNDFGRTGYGGPCPPPGSPHRYFFKLYALDCDLELKPGASRNELLDRMGSHILAEGKLMGTYQR